MARGDQELSRSAVDHYIEQMRKLAEVGASACCYLPGSGNPEAWPDTRCDCKALPELFSLRREYIQLGGVASDGRAARAGRGDLASR